MTCFTVKTTAKLGFPTLFVFVAVEVAARGVLIVYLKIQPEMFRRSNLQDS